MDRRALASGGGVLLRTAYSPEGQFKYKTVEQADCRAVFTATDGYASFTVLIETLEENNNFLHFTVKMTPVGDLMMPYWPVDLYPIDTGWDALKTKGIVRAAQRGPGTGMIYLSLLEPESGSLLYVQNLTALNAYCAYNHTEPSTRVGGELAGTRLHPAAGATQGVAGWAGGSHL